MQVDGKMRMCGTSDTAFRGVLYGLMAGAVSGPVVVIAWMFSLDFLYPDTAFMATGLEMPGSLVVGAILGAMEGPLLGLLWAIRPRRLTLWWLMVAVAMFATILGLFKFNPVLGLFAITVPLMMAVLMRIMAQDSADRADRRRNANRIRSRAPAHRAKRNRIRSRSPIHRVALRTTGALAEASANGPRA